MWDSGPAEEVGAGPGQPGRVPEAEPGPTGEAIAGDQGPQPSGTGGRVSDLGASAAGSEPSLEPPELEPLPSVEVTCEERAEVPRGRSLRV